MLKILKRFNHEIWTFCCESWFDRRVDSKCPKCNKPVNKNLC